MSLYAQCPNCGSIYLVDDGDKLMHARQRLQFPGIPVKVCAAHCEVVPILDYQTTLTWLGLEGFK